MRYVGYWDVISIIERYTKKGGKRKILQGINNLSENRRNGCVGMCVGWRYWSIITMRYVECNKNPLKVLIVIGT